MADFRVQAGFFAHPKTIKLQRRCGGDGVLAFLRLWGFCASTPGRSHGDLSDMTVEDVEIAAGWGGELGALVQALVDVGYLDGSEGSFAIHDFVDHQEYLAGKRQRSLSAKRANAIRWHNQGRHAEKSQDCPLCYPEPSDRSPTGSESDSGSEQSGVPLSLPLPSSPLPSLPLPPGGGSVSDAILEVRNRAAAECGLSAPGNETERAIARLVPFKDGALDYALKKTAEADNPNWTYLVKCLRNPKPNARGSPSPSPTAGYHPGSKPEEFGNGDVQL